MGRTIQSRYMVSFCIESKIMNKYIESESRTMVTKYGEWEKQDVGQRVQSCSSYVR